MTQILVVDDEVGIRELLSEILSDEGYAVSTAENAHAARNLLQQNHYDLILLDIWMPDMDGISLLKELKVRRLVENSSVIMMSGHATMDSESEALKIGALSFLEKPISMKKLLETVVHGIEVSERKVALAKYRVDPEPAAPAGPPPTPASPPPRLALPKIEIAGTGIVIDFERPLREVRVTAEKAYLLAVMNYESCQMTRVARHAGLERTHLYRKLKALNVDIPRSLSSSNPLMADDAHANEEDLSDEDNVNIGNTLCQDSQPRENLDDALQSAQPVVPDKHTH